MSWLSHSQQKHQLKKRLVTGVSAFVLASSSLAGLLPAASAHAATGDGLVTIGLITGASFTNVGRLQGTVQDTDGVDEVNVSVLNAANGQPLGNALEANVEDGTWSLQLSKSTAPPINLANANVMVRVAVTDETDDTTSQTFGTFRYVIPDADVFQHVVEVLSGLDPSRCSVSAALQSQTAITVFGPNNEALAALPASELAALLASPDELCAVVGNHVVQGRIASDDVEDGDVPSIESGNEDLHVEGGRDVSVNGAEVVNADNPVSYNGLLHVVSAVVAPVSNEVNIDDVYTSNMSPALHGEVENPNAVVSVRVNGTSFAAKNNGDGTWIIPAGVVTVDPHKADTLFTVTAKIDVRSGASTTQQLLGLTMRSDVLHFRSASVLSADDENDGEAAVTTASVVASAEQACDATCLAAQTAAAQAAAGQTTSTSVAQNEATNPPAKPTPQPAETPKKDETKPSSTSQWYWWLIGIATLGALYYVLGGNTTPTKEK